MTTKHRRFVRYINGKEWFDVHCAIRSNIDGALGFLRNDEKSFPDPIQHPEKISMQLRLESSISYDTNIMDFAEILKTYHFSESGSSVEVLSSLPKGTVEMTISWEEPEEYNSIRFTRLSVNPYPPDLFGTWIRKWNSERGERTEDMGRNHHLEIKKVIFNEPATIVLWNDGTKTVVKTHGKEKFDPEKGLAMAVSKKVLGTNESGSNYYDVFKNWITKSTEEENEHNRDILSDCMRGIINSLADCCR